MPLLGFGVYQNYDAKTSVLEAFSAGYRSSMNLCYASLSFTHGFRHVDSAQAYKNETAVGEAVKESGIPREEIFISGFSLSF